METLDALRLKKARELAWNSGNKAAMLRWLSQEVIRASAVPAEFKSGYLAQCRAMLGRYGGGLEYRALNPHWEVQPRVPRGNPDGGQWTQLAGDVPTPDSDGPSVPKQRPATIQQRNRISKELARYGNRPGGPEIATPIIETVSWLGETASSIISYWDSPKSLEELQTNALSRAAGYDIHHIVEQTAAVRDGHPRSKIDGPDNLVRIPRLKHHEINGWFQTAREAYEGLPPREYLKGKPWEVRTRVGLEALRQTGVLKP